MRGIKKIRNARRADRDAILQLEQYFPSDRMSARSVAGFLRSRGAHVGVAELNGEILGAAVLLFRRNSRSARLYSVVVHARARGAGVGGALVQAAEHAARLRGCDAVSLEVREGSRAARALYRKLGYAEAAALPGYYENGAAGLRLRKAL